MMRMNPLFLCLLTNVPPYKIKTSFLPYITKYKNV